MRCLQNLLCTICHRLVTCFASCIAERISNIVVLHRGAALHRFAVLPFSATFCGLRVLSPTLSLFVHAAKGERASLSLCFAGLSAELRRRVMLTRCRMSLNCGLYGMLHVFILRGRELRSFPTSDVLQLLCFYMPDF